MKRLKRNVTLETRRDKIEASLVLVAFGALVWALIVMNSASFGTLFVLFTTVALCSIAVLISGVYHYVKDRRDRKVPPG